MPTFLITGATGFIGQHLIARLLAEDCGVRALSRGPADLAGPLRANLSGLESVSADITDPASLSGVCDGVEVVINLAGALGRWGVSREQMDTVNVQGSMNMARESMRAG